MLLPCKHMIKPNSHSEKNVIFVYTPSMWRYDAFFLQSLHLRVCYARPAFSHCNLDSVFSVMDEPGTVLCPLGVFPVIQVTKSSLILFRQTDLSPLRLWLENAQWPWQATEWQLWVSSMGTDLLQDISLLPPQSQNTPLKHAPSNTSHFAARLRQLPLF